MGLAFIPFYIKYLGIEAYGLIGLFAVLQAWLSLLDLGMAPTLGREMARFTGHGQSAEGIRDLLRSIEIIALGIAVLIAGGVAISSNWIATSWIKAETLPVDLVRQAVVLMGLVTATRFIESIYRSSIVGLQRHVLFNVVNSAIATLRGLGAVGVLVLISPSIKAFFIWQGLVSIASVFILAATTYSILPCLRAGKFSMGALRSVWHFAGGMVLITFFGLLLTQIDKILLSKLLSLTEYGYYTLATIVAGTLYIVITPITQAFYPRLCELYTLNDEAGLVETHHKGAQMVSVFAGSAAIFIIVFAETFLRLWTHDMELADRTSFLLRLLMLGNLLNVLMWIPYQTQLAHGLTKLSVCIDLVAVALIVPAILWVTPLYGAEGAAWVWVGLNIGYLIIGVHFMYRRILNTEKFRWYIRDLLMPISAGLLVALVLKTLWIDTQTEMAELLLLGFAAVLILSASLFNATFLRKNVLQIIKSYWLRLIMQITN